jgi:hypothetical protein
MGHPRLMRIIIPLLRGAAFSGAALPRFASFREFGPRRVGALDAGVFPE